jgi:hypothetical protein
MDKRKGGQIMTAGYDTLIVTFSDPICVLDRMFDCPAWGVESLKEWIDGYESTRMTSINDHTAVITSEYNTVHVVEWLRKHTPIAEMKEF